MDIKRKLSPWLLACGWAVLLGLAAYLPSFWSARSMDIAVYWEAGTRMRLGAVDLYAEPTDPENDIGLYIYPPLFAALMAPLTWLPRGFGYAAWAMLQWLIAVLAFVVTGRMVGLHASPRSMTGLGSLTSAAGPEDSKGASFALPLLVAVFGAAWTNFSEGQVNFLLVLFVAAGLWQLETGRTIRGGLLLAAAAHLKVIPIVLLLVLLAQRRFKAAGAMFVGCSVLWLVPLVWTVPAHGVVDGVARNIELTREYADSIVSPRVKSQSPDDVGGVRAPNNSLGAVVNRYFGNDQRLATSLKERSPLLFSAPEPLRKWGGFGLGCLLFSAALLLAWRRREHRNARNAAAGLALLSAALGNLLFWPHHLALLLLVLGPLLAFAMDEPRLRRIGWALCIAVLALCFLPMIDNEGGWLVWVQVLGTPTLCVLAVFAVVWITFMRRGIAGDGLPPILPRDDETDTRNSAA
ncbi:MAG: DUF2029 domain-containing protein [Planctomycetes bacterium]|nr:DUF2029 domain-containing protein [Planctomycetota bacterium]